MTLIPNKKDAHNSSDEQLYFLTEHWKTDLGFFQEELNFLDHLVHKNFVHIAGEEGIKNWGHLSGDIQFVSLEASALLTKVNNHLHNYAHLESDVLDQGGAIYREEHVEIEAKLDHFIKNFRKLKKEIFEASKEVLKRGKGK